MTLFPLLGRAIVLVREDQLSLAIGRRGQNVRLASQLVGWDLEIMTSGELAELTQKAVASFTRLDGVDIGLARNWSSKGYSASVIFRPSRFRIWSRGSRA